MRKHHGGPSTLPTAPEEAMENPTDAPLSAASGQPQRSEATARTIWLSLGGISLVAGIGSYLSTLVVIQAARGHALMTYFEAALADPTIAAASVNLVDAHRHHAKVPKFSIVSIAVAAVVTLGANYFVTDPLEVPKWLVNVWTPVAFLLAFESLMSYLRRGHAAASPGGVATQSHGDHCPHSAAADLAEAVRIAYEHGRDCEGTAPRYTELEARFGVNRKRVAELVKGPAPQLVTASANGSTAP